MIITLQELLLLISFGIIYFVFLFYDLFKRGDNYGSFVYIVAVIPINYLWYVVSNHGLFEFGLTGCMLLLTGMWLLAVVRDIYLKDKSQGYKDADDVALMLAVGIIINLILAAVLPAFNNLSAMQTGADKMMGFFYFPITQPGLEYGPAAAIMLTYKILVTVLTLSMIYPTVIDLRDASVNLVAILILTVVFGLPFLFLAFIWAPNSGLIWVILVLFLVLFFTFLLIITKGSENR